MKGEERTELLIRALRAKDKLAGVGYTNRVIRMLPHLDSPKGKVRIKNVARGLVVDAQITEALERLVEMDSELQS